MSRDYSVESSTVLFLFVPEWKFSCNFHKFLNHRFSCCCWCCCSMTGNFRRARVADISDGTMELMATDFCRNENVASAPSSIWPIQKHRWIIVHKGRLEPTRLFFNDYQQRTLIQIQSKVLRLKLFLFAIRKRFHIFLKENNIKISFNCSSIICKIEISTQ